MTDQQRTGLLTRRDYTSVLQNSESLFSLKCYMLYQYDITTLDDSIGEVPIENTQSECSTHTGSAMF